MNIGKLDTRCRIEKKTVTSDPIYGAETSEWALLAVVWCNLQDLLPSKSEEVIKNGLAVALNRTRIRMRYRTDVDGAMRLVINRPTRNIYQIISGPAVLGNKDGLEMVVEKASS